MTSEERALESFVREYAKGIERRDPELDSATIRARTLRGLREVGRLAAEELRRDRVASHRACGRRR
jgi:hypothetical protein